MAGNEPVVAEPEVPTGSAGVSAAVVGGLVVLLLGIVAHYLNKHVPDWAAHTSFSRVASALEYPVYAIALGLLGNLVLAAVGVRDRLAGGFRTEFLIKTGLVLLGASINLKIIVTRPVRRSPRR
jgi:uncharacterized membrane protein YadS